MSLPDLTYVGFDLSREYVKDARRRYGHRGEFFQASVTAELLDGRQFDIVVAEGVVHHLDDEETKALFELARSVLRPGGRLVTKDPVLMDSQRPLVRYVISRDRGDHVRAQGVYEALASRTFKSVEATVDETLLRFPYTHLIMKCTAQGGTTLS